MPSARVIQSLCKISLSLRKDAAGRPLLTSTLDRHPDIRCDDEILIVPRLFPRRFVDSAARHTPARVYGFHVKIYQLASWQRVDDVGKWLGSMHRGGWKIIYLRRENLLRQVVSNVFAETVGTYHHRDCVQPSRPERIALPIERLHNSIDARQKYLAAERNALKGLDHLELMYERDLEAPEAQAGTFTRILSYLGVAGHTRGGIS